MQFISVPSHVISREPCLWMHGAPALDGSVHGKTLPQQPVRATEILPRAPRSRYTPGIKISDLIRYVLVAAMVGFGAVGGWRNLGPGSFQIAGPESATDATGQALLGVPHFAAQLREKLQGTGPDRGLVVAGPGSWMTDDVVRLAKCLLTPRLVERLSRNGNSRNPAAILLFQTPPSEAARALPWPAEAFGPDSSIVILHPAKRMDSLLHDS